MNGVLFWASFVVVFLSAIYAALVQDNRRAILAVWICGWAVGAIFLSLHIEFLALVQWMISAVLGATFFIYSMIFGPNNERVSYGRMVLPVLVGCGFIGVVFFGLGKGEWHFSSLNLGQDGLVGLGQELLNKHFLTFEILVLTLFLILIGAGVLGRAEDPERKSG